MPQEAAMSQNNHTSRIFAVALIALLLGAGGFGYWRSTQDRLPEGLSMGNGRLESTEVQIAAKIPGRLAEVRVDEGDKVLKGQLLARMDTRTLEAQRAQAEAEVLRAKENFAAAEANVQLRQSEQLLANQELKRTQELYKRGFASSQLIDQQQARQNTGNAAVIAAQAQVNSVKAAIGAATPTRNTSAWTRWFTTSVSSKTTGNRQHWAPGVWAGKSGSTVWKSLSSLTSSK